MFICAKYQVFHSLFFILNFWEPFENEDIDMLPVVFVTCTGEKERYVLKKDNIIMGSEKDICLT